MYHTRRSLATVCAGSVRVAYFIARNFHSTVRIMQPLDTAHTTRMLTFSVISETLKKH